MSLNSIVSKQLQESGKRLSSLKDLSRYLLEDVQNRMEKQRIEPIAGTQFALLSASITASQASSLLTKDGNLFLDTTTKRLRVKIRETIGHSPDIISDIAKKIGDVIKDIINKALKPVIKIIESMGKSVSKGLSKLSTDIGKTFNVVIKDVGKFITNGFNSIGKGVNFIQSTVNNLLKGVIRAADTFTLMLRKVFDDLALKLEAILRITPEAMFNLQKELQNLFQKEQANLVKSLIKKG